MGDEQRQRRAKVRVTPGDLAKVILVDVRRMHAHAAHESARDQPPEQLATFFREGLEAVVKAAGLLVLALDTASTRRSAEERQEAEARETLQAMAAGLHRLFDAMQEAKALHDARGEAAPSIDATAKFTWALVEFLDGFSDMKAAGLAAPVVTFARMLGTVGIGARRPRFARTVAAVPHRTTPLDEAEIMGRAACALDARMKAEPEARMSVHAKAVADAIQGAARSVFGKTLEAKKIEDWRNRAKAGAAGKPKGFKPDHPAMGVWRRYEKEIVQHPARGRTYRAEHWLRAAAVYEVAIRSDGGPISPGNTDREKT